MSAYEEPYYRSGPIVLSMFSRYLLIAAFIAAVHVPFGIGYEAPEAEGGLKPRFESSTTPRIDRNRRFLRCDDYPHVD